jgi:hypothetical protein
LGVNGKGDNEKKKGQECGADVSVTGRSWGHERIVAWDLLGARNGNGKRSSTEGTEGEARRSRRGIERRGRRAGGELGVLVTGTGVRFVLWVWLGG